MSGANRPKRIRRFASSRSRSRSCLRCADDPGCDTVMSRDDRWRGSQVRNQSSYPRRAERSAKESRAASTSGASHILL